MDSEGRSGTHTASIKFYEGAAIIALVNQKRKRNKSKNGGVVGCKKFMTLGFF